MTREQAKELLPIIQAFAEGKTIQTISSKGVFEDVTTSLSFDGPYHAYRIKPESREFWIGIPILDKTPDQGRLDARVEDAAVWKEPVTSVRYEIIHVREVLE